MTENSSKPLICPKCSAELAADVREGSEVHGCRKCGGVWIDYETQRKLLKSKMEPFTLDEVRRLRDKFQPLGRTEPIQYVPCPSCRQLMQRKNWGSHSGVIVDFCKEHGTWYDENELEKIFEFVALGGVELEKLRNAEKSFTRLESKLETTSLRLDKKIDSAYRRARIFSMLGF